MTTLAQPMPQPTEAAEIFAGIYNAQAREKAWRKL